MHVPGVGPVIFEKSPRARRISISLRPMNGFRVAVPPTVSFARALQSVLTRIPWMKKHHAKMRLHEQEHSELPQNNHSLSRQDARRKLVSRLALLAEQHGFQYNRVFVRNQKTLWGSCSGRNNINLNIRLLNLPENLMDFVLIHELLHTRIKHHGPEFWNELEQLVPDASRCRQQLRQYRISLLGS